LNLNFILLRFIYLFIISLIVKQISFQFFLGKFARNLKFILIVSLVSFISSVVFYSIIYLSHSYLSNLLIAIYFSSIFLYLCLFIAMFIGLNLIVEFPLYTYVFIRGKFSRGEIFSLLLMVNMFSYLFAYLFGFVDPLSWM